MLSILLACSRPVSSTENVVLIVGCTVRRDQVGAYGGPDHTTPFLDGLAARGTRYEDPIAAAPWTRAAATAIFTGHHALSIGMVEPGEGLNQRALPDAVDTMAERYRRKGFRTVGGTSNPNLNSVYGFQQGYDTYTEPESTWLEDRAKWKGPDFLASFLPTIPAVSATPTFVSATLVDAHAPFQTEGVDLTPFTHPSGEVTRYRYALHGLDRTIESLFEGLEARGYTEENTRFVIVSDHGEGLLQPLHHGISHGRYLYGTAAESIWIEVGKDVPVRTVPGVVSQIDLLPTLLHTDTPGVDLSLAARTEPVFTDTWFRNENRAAVWTNEQVCMRDFGPQTVEAPTGQFHAGCFERRDRYQKRPLRGDFTVLDSWRAAHPLVEGMLADDRALQNQLRALGYLE